MTAVIHLAQQLVRLDTAGHGEEAAVQLLQRRLEAQGVQCDRHLLAPGRASLVCRLPGRDSLAPALCFTGHLDTVPVGNVAWREHPHGGRVEGDRLWGRGSADMKGGVAAMVVALEALAATDLRAPVVLALCAAEETGALGAAQIAPHLGNVGAIVVGEPTGNRVAVAHKGVAWIRLRAAGVAAHASTPHLGVNAIEMMTRALVKIGDLVLTVAPRPHLDAPTINIGTISGGVAPNVVPDHCEALVDVRLVPGFAPDAALTEIQRAVGEFAQVTIQRALKAVETSPDDPWMRRVLTLVGGEPCGVAYFTDASELTATVGDVPVAIIGPGDAALAHQVDEWCSAAAIERATAVYEQIAREWTGGS
ncbi:MAG: M20 family metallopeptidase [Ilumatobacteraceae bacterium]